MKKGFVGIPLAALIFLGAGCQKTSVQPGSAVTAPTPITTIVTPSSTMPTVSSTTAYITSSTLPTVIQTDWQTDTLLSSWAIQHPSKADVLDPNSDDVKKEGLILRVNLGTAVENIGTRTVPVRKLEVRRVKRGDLRLEGCDPEVIGKQGITEVTTVATSLGTVLCLQKSTDAGAGNLFHTSDYLFFTSDGPYVFSFTTRSVQCVNFERPAEQCVAYDEARDTAIFPQIMGTLARKNP